MNTNEIYYGDPNWDGKTFPNGLPEKRQIVEVTGCWWDGWKTVVFCDYIGWSSYANADRYYDWFSVYAVPDVENGSNPIVTSWRGVDST
jgi:hypothetical protein